LLAGRSSSIALVEQSLGRIDALDNAPGGLGAVVTLNPDAMASAESADAELRRGERRLGPLHGIPILVKDVFETRGIPTTFGCAAFAGYVPDQDAIAVGRLRAAGAIILGKTSTPDLAMSWLSDSSLGTTLNARSAAHEAGGSSAGSAVAVAAALVPAALGSDTGGSVRVPASFNGVVGIRPTTGLVPAEGMSALLASQDTPGPLAACVDDAALLLAVLAGTRWPMGDQPRRLESYRIGALVTPPGPLAWEGADEADAVFREALGRLRAQGAHVEDEVHVAKLDELVRDTSLYLVSARADIDSFLASRSGLGGRTFRDLYDAGVFPQALDLAHLLATSSQADDRLRAERLSNRRRLRGAVAQAMDSRGLDALAYLTVRVPAPRRDRDGSRFPSRLLPVNTLVAAQADLPALTLPAGRTSQGLPIGLELVGRHGADLHLLELGRAVEHTLGTWNAQLSLENVPHRGLC